MSDPVIHHDAHALSQAIAGLRVTGCAATRAALDLPTDRPVVMTGHQPVAWHPGILAKAVAAHAIAERTGAVPAVLVIDTVDLHPMRMEIPVGDPPSDLDVVTVDLLDDAPGVLCRRPAGRVRTVSLDDAATDDVRAGVMRLHESCVHAAGPTAGAQAMSILGAWLEVPMTLVAASALWDTPAAHTLMSALREDPEAARASYNDALEQHPAARVRRLGSGELPLWVLDDAIPRHAHIDDLHRPNGDFLPRALVTTALARCGACDLFVHGIGGSRYDVAMVAWVDAWLGWSPCPSIEVSADMTLDLGAASAQATAHARRQHALRSARHDPSARGRGPSPRKSSALHEIGAHPPHSDDRADAFISMHDGLEQARDPIRLGRLEDAVEAARRSIDIAARRDWPAVCTPSSAVEGMAEAIRHLVSEA